MNKELRGILDSVGPQAVEIAVMILRAAPEKDTDKLLPALQELADFGWRREASEYAQLHAQVRENTEKIKRGEHPNNFVADGGIVFHKHEEVKCPHCQSMIVSAQFCEQAMKESGGYGGLIMCANNDYVQPQTDGTGECDYEAWLPPRLDASTNNKPCKGCD